MKLREAFPIVITAAIDWETYSRSNDKKLSEAITDVKLFADKMIMIEDMYETMEKQNQENVKKLLDIISGTHGISG